MLFEVAHRKKMGILRLKDVYYAEKIRKDDPDYDAVYYFFCQESTNNSKTYLTTAVNLSLDERDLLASFRKSTRQDIKRIINDENLNIDIIQEPEDDQITSFMLTYNQFTRKKGFYPADQYRVDTLHKAGRIVMLEARYDKELVVQQMMMEDEHRAVSLYGYTIRLEESDPEKLRLISSISKMVDYACMLYWKKRNKRYYDLGGLFMEPANPSGDNINHYKKGFRGDLLTEHEFIYPLTWKGKVFCWLKEVKKRMAAPKRDKVVGGVVGLKRNKVVEVFKKEGLPGVWTRIKQRFIVKSSIYQIDLEQIQEDIAAGEPVDFQLMPMTEALFQQMVEVYDDEIPPEKKRMLWGRLDDKSTDRAYLMVEKDGPILGFYCVSYGDNVDIETNYVVKEAPGTAFLFDAYTFKAQRRRGAQKHVVIELLRMLKQKGLTTVTVMIDNTNVYSQKATLNYGFYKTGEVSHINLRIWKGNIERKYDRHDR